MGVSMRRVDSSCCVLQPLLLQLLPLQLQLHAESTTAHTEAAAATTVVACEHAPLSKDVSTAAAAISSYNRCSNGHQVTRHVLSSNSSSAAKLPVLAPYTPVNTPLCAVLVQLFDADYCSTARALHHIANM
jgi:hypothetical protein